MPGAAMNEHERLAFELLGALDDLLHVRMAPLAGLLDGATVVPRGDLVHQHLGLTHQRLPIEQLDLRVPGGT